MDRRLILLTVLVIVDREYLVEPNKVVNPTSGGIRNPTSTKTRREISNWPECAAYITMHEHGIKAEGGSNRLRRLI